MIKYCFKGLYLFLRGIFLGSFFWRRRINRIYPERIRSVAALRIDRIGDVVVSLPALKALKEIFPQCRLTIILREQNMPLLKALPWIDELVAYKGFWGTVWFLRRRRFDILIDLLMDYSLKTAWIAYLSKSALTVGSDLEGRGRLFNAALKPSPVRKLMSLYLLDLVRFLAGLSGLDKGNIKDSLPELEVFRKNKDFAEDFLREGGINPGEFLIAMHPGGYFPSQRWGIERFAQVADVLSQRYQAKIIVLAGANDARMAENFRGLVKAEALICAGLSLDKIAAIIARSDIFIGNNSGLLHIAAALGRPTVSTMGPTVPWLWMPQGDNQIVIRHNLECAPCSRGVCGEHKCMELISVEEVVKAVDSLTKDTRRVSG